MVLKPIALAAFTAFALTAPIQPAFAQAALFGAGASALSGLGGLGAGLTSAGLAGASEVAGIFTTIIGEEGENEAGETMSGSSTGGSTGGTSSTN